MLKIEKKYNPKKEIEIIPSLQPKKIKKSDFSIITSPIQLVEKIKYLDIISQIRADIFYKYSSLKGDVLDSLPIGGITVHYGESTISDINKFSKNKEHSSRKLKRLGISHSDINHTSIGEKISHNIRNFFSEKVKDKIFFQEECINYRSVNRQSIVSTEEIDFKSVKRKKYKIKYFVDTKKECLTISTLYPETIFGDVALAVNPVDRRYKKLIGSKVIVPIINKTIPIVGDESVDMQIDNGVVRVTPSHDRFGLNIAIKHNLKKDKKAIDGLGLFTTEAGDFSGKKVVDFRENVIQYLDDICNLGEVQDILADVAYHKETGEELMQVISNQWFIKISEKTIEDIVNNDYLVSSNYKKTLIDEEFKKVNQICISNNQQFGISIPVRIDDKSNKYILDDEKILESYKKNGKTKKILLSLIVANLYLDRRIGDNFSLEELIDLLVSPSVSPGYSLVDSYIDTYKAYAKTNDFPKSFYSEIDELSDIIKFSDKNNISYLDKLTSDIIRYLEKSFLITNSNQVYSLDIKSILPDNLDRQTLTFDQNIITSMILLDSIGYLSEKSPKGKPNLFIVPHDQVINTIKNILLCKELVPSFSFKSLFILDPIDQKEKNKIGFGKKSFTDISDIIESCGGDASRLLLLFSIQNKLSENIISEYQNFVNKLWNASRLIIMQGDSGKRKRHFDKIQKEAEKLKDISLYDQWIIHKLKDFYQDYQYMFSNLDLSSILQSLESLIKSDFCDKYIEMQKIKKSKNLEIYGFFILGIICKIIYPFMPFISQKIRNNCLFEGNVQDTTFEPFFLESEKNYKTQLIIDIIDKISHIKDKKNRNKNDSIKLCISTSTDLIDYISHHESIIKKISCANEIEYKKNLPIENLGYEVDSMINITIGVKKIEENNKIQEKSVGDLQEELSLCNQEIQKMRSIISTLSQRTDHESLMQIDERKKELIKIKKKSERIELEILTIKSKN